MKIFFILDTFLEKNRLPTHWWDHILLVQVGCVWQTIAKWTDSWPKCDCVGTDSYTVQQLLQRSWFARIVVIQVVGPSFLANTIIIIIKRILAKESPA